MEKLTKVLGSMAAMVVMGGFILLGLPSFAHADFITFPTGGVFSGNYSFMGNGTGSVTVTTSGISGAASFGADATGSFTLGATTFTAGPVSAGMFPTTGTESFSFTSPDGDMLSGTITWSFIQDNTNSPKFFGVLTIGAISGDAAFLATYGGVGSKAKIDFLITSLSGGYTLETLATTTNTATGSISNGEVTPTPEASSAMLLGLGIALIGLCAIPRQRGWLQHSENHSSELARQERQQL